MPSYYENGSSRSTVHVPAKALLKLGKFFVIGLVAIIGVLIRICFCCCRDKPTTDTASQNDGQVPMLPTPGLTGNVPPTPPGPGLTGNVPPTPPDPGFRSNIPAMPLGPGIGPNPHMQYRFLSDPPPPYHSL